jgi:hypothetical protein
MRNDLQRYMRWEGVWTGRGESQAGQVVIVRCEFSEALRGEAMGMHFEALDESLGILYHGVHAYLAPTRQGDLRCSAHSTIHGPLIFDRTPDDEGVLALTGMSVAGNQISVTFVEEDPTSLMFTAFWRPPNAALNENLPRMHCRLSRPALFVPPRR